MKRIFVLFGFLLLSQSILAKTVDLAEALKIVIDSHPEVDASKSNFQAESKSITASYFPDNPMIGIMKQNGMKSWTLSQEFLFPTKYFHRASAQSKRALVAQEEFKQKKLEIRQRVITSYYDFLMQQKTLENLEAQRDLLREIARIAESRRSIGQVTAQDEMKAHLEQSKIENEILSAEQDLEMAMTNLKGLLGDDGPLEIGNLQSPKLTIPTANLKDISFQETPKLKMASFRVDEANAIKSFARDNFLPDFKISLQGSMEKNNNDKSITVELKFPIWFWAKESEDFSSAIEKSIVAQKNWESNKREILSSQRSLVAKIIAKENILKLYKTTLIPQAKSTISSSRSAYQTGRVSLMELLDSERTVYGLQISYYQELKEYASAISEFESNSGQSISTLPFGGIL